MDFSKLTKITNTQFMKGLATKRNMLVFGPSGWGKTATVEEYAKANGLKIAYLDLAGLLPESIAGIPVYVKEEGETGTYYRRMLDGEFKEFLECEGEGWILFIDEINQGQPDALNTLYGITHPTPLTRRWAGHRISKCQIVACGNLNDGRDGTVYLTDLPTPLLNRFFLFELIPSKKDAKAWLKTEYKNIPQVVKYIDEMLNNDIAPRDIAQVLDVIQYEDDSMFVEAKLGPALASRMYEIQKSIKSVNPAEILNGCKEVYRVFKEDGSVRFGVETIDNIDDLKAKFSELLSEEEIAGILKGE